MLRTRSKLRVMLLVCCLPATDGSRLHSSWHIRLCFAINVLQAGGLQRPWATQVNGSLEHKHFLFKKSTYFGTEQAGDDKSTNFVGLSEEGRRWIYSTRIKDRLEIYKRRAPRNTETDEKITMGFNFFGYGSGR